MEQDAGTKSGVSLTIPAAIVVAGLIVAISIFATRGDAESAVRERPGSEPQAAAAASLSFRPIGEDDHILGNPDAPIVFIEYSDTECPFCQRFHPVLKAAMEANGKKGTLAWVYRHLPLDRIHPKARYEAEALECAGNIGGEAMFWRYVDEIFARKDFTVSPPRSIAPGDLPSIAGELGIDEGRFRACLAAGTYKERVARDAEDAIRAGGRGTPHNVFVLSAPLPASVRQELSALYEPFRDPNAGEHPLTFWQGERVFDISASIPADILEETISLLLAALP